MLKICPACMEDQFETIKYYKNSKNGDILAFCDECTTFFILDESFNEVSYPSWNNYRKKFDKWTDLEEIELSKEA